jgi:hypothetical protein
MHPIDPINNLYKAKWRRPTSKIGGKKSLFRRASRLLILRFAYNRNLYECEYKYADTGYEKCYPSGWGNVMSEIGIQ